MPGFKRIGGDVPDEQLIPPGVDPALAQQQLAAARGIASPATEEFLATTMPLTPQALPNGERVGQTPETPAGERLLLGRYPNTPEGVAQLEEAARFHQSAAARAENVLAGVKPFVPLLEELTERPEKIPDVLAALRGEPTGEQGMGSGTTPEIKIEALKDEMGLPTGEVRIDAESLNTHIARVASLQAANIVRDTLQEQDRKQKLSRGIEAFRAAHPEASDEQIKSMLSLGSRDPAEVLETLWSGYGGAAQAAARLAGQQEILDQQNRAAAATPSLGSIPGQPLQVKSSQQLQADEILAAAKEAQKANLFANL